MGRKVFSGIQNLTIRLEVYPYFFCIVPIALQRSATRFLQKGFIFSEASFVLGKARLYNLYKSKTHILSS
jgi:hypothetical protein